MVRLSEQGDTHLNEVICKHNFSFPDVILFIHVYLIATVGFIQNLTDCLLISSVTVSQLTRTLLKQKLRTTHRLCCWMSRRLMRDCLPRYRYCLPLPVSYRLSYQIRRHLPTSHSISSCRKVCELTAHVWLRYPDLLAHPKTVKWQSEVCSISYGCKRLL